jgi:hypothetical protein
VTRELPRRIDRRPLAIVPGEILCVCCVRNEALRLPYFLAYHRDRGIDRFLVVDNGSDDGTTDVLAAEPDVHVFHTEQPYSEARCGVDWFNGLLDAHAAGHWAVTVDVDELLTYPMSEEVSLRRLTLYLGQRQEEALLAFLLDMYAAGPIRESTYTRGRPFLETCSYFDRDSYVWEPEHEVYRHVPCRGGPRARLFWSGRNRDRPSPFLPKIPLVRWRKGLAYSASTHVLAGAHLADITGALLHFKFFADFGERAGLESRRAQHWESGGEYKVYDEVLESTPALDALYEGSERYTSSQQLVTLGLVRMPSDYPPPP